MLTCSDLYHRRISHEDLTQQMRLEKVVSQVNQLFDELVHARKKLLDAAQGPGKIHGAHTFCPIHNYCRLCNCGKLWKTVQICDRVQHASASTQSDPKFVYELRANPWWSPQVLQELLMFLCNTNNAFYGLEYTCDTFGHAIIAV
jgi:hypothetical protein